MNLRYRKHILVFVTLILFLSGVEIVFSNDTRQEKLSVVISFVLESEWGEGNVVWMYSGNIRIPEFDNSAELSVVSVDKPVGSVVLKARIQKSGHLLKEFPVSIRVMPFTWIPVASQVMERHTVLNSENVKWERREVTRLNGSWPESVEELAENEWWTKRKVQKDEILLNGRIERKPDVAYGDCIELLAVRGSITISTEGTALQDGFTGERIRVENAKSGVRLKGVIQDKGVVLVEGYDGRNNK